MTFTLEESTLFFWIQAAFVDIGTEKAGFLHVSDLVSAEEDDEDEDEPGSARARGDSRRDAGGRSGKYPPIQGQIKKGETVVVQVTKEPSGPKGHVSLRRSRFPADSSSTCPSRITLG